MWRLILTLIPLVLVSCSSEQLSEENSVDSGVLARILEADSLLEAHLADPVTANHNHGADLAVHAHQDIGKKRRVLRQSLAVRDSRREANALEQQRRLEYLLSRGIISDSTL